MKKKLKKIMFFVLIGIFCLGINSVNAATVTDFSNVSLECAFEDDSNHLLPKIKINGVEFETSVEGETYYNYYALISHSSTEFEDVYNYDAWSSTDNRSVAFTEGEAFIYDIDDYLSEAGDIYVTLYEYAGNSATYTKATNAIKVDRPPYLPLSKRFKVFPFKDYTSIYLFDFGGFTENRTVNYKIGKIPSELLKTLKNDTSDGLSQLLTYAKDDTDFNKEGSVDLSENSSEILSNSSLVDQDYYYIYLELDDENGTYYPVEDVSLYQAKALKASGYITLYDYTNEDFSWSGGESKATEETVKNPKTGLYYGYGVLALIIITGSTIYFVTRKKSKFPQA